jgi:hypothetical protein
VEVGARMDHGTGAGRFELPLPGASSSCVVLGAYAFHPVLLVEMYPGLEDPVEVHHNSAPRPETYLILHMPAHFASTNTSSQ